MIMWLIVRCFSVSDKHGQTSNVIWLSTTWLLIFWLDVANKKPLFTTKPASIWVEIFCFTVTKFCIEPAPGCYTRKMLFANASKIIKNWLLTLQPDNYPQFAKVGTRMFGRFGILTWRALGGWVWNLISFSQKPWEDLICEWPLTQVY